MAVTSGQQGQQPTGGNNSSRLYLYSFIATLAAIVALTIALSARVIFHRRRLRQLLHDAAIEGANYDRFSEMARHRGVRVPHEVLTMMGAPAAPAPAAGRRTKKEVKLGRTPLLWESRLMDPDSDGDDDGSSDEGASEARWEKAASLSSTCWQPLFVSVPAQPKPKVAEVSPLATPSSSMRFALARLGLTYNSPVPPPPNPPVPAPNPSSTNGTLSDEKVHELLYGPPGADETADSRTSPSAPVFLTVGVLVRPPEAPEVKSARLARQRSRTAATGDDELDDEEEPLVEVELGWAHMALDRS